MSQCATSCGWPDLQMSICVLTKSFGLLTICAAQISLHSEYCGVKPITLDVFWLRIRRKHQPVPCLSCALPFPHQLSVELQSSLLRQLLPQASGRVLQRRSADVPWPDCQHYFASTPSAMPQVSELDAGDWQHLPPSEQHTPQAALAQLQAFYCSLQLGLLLLTGQCAPLVRQV